MTCLLLLAIIALTSFLPSILSGPDFGFTFLPSLASDPPSANQADIDTVIMETAKDAEAEAANIAAEEATKGFVEGAGKAIVEEAGKGPPEESGKPAAEEATMRPTGKAGEPVLHEPAQEVSPGDVPSEKIQGVIDQMIAVMRKAPGVGLAAPQIGVPLKVRALHCAPVICAGLCSIFKRQSLHCSTC